MTMTLMTPAAPAARSAPAISDQFEAGRAVAPDAGPFAFARMLAPAGQTVADATPAAAPSAAAVGAPDQEGDAGADLDEAADGAALSAMAPPPNPPIPFGAALAGPVAAPDAGAATGANEGMTVAAASPAAHARAAAADALAPATTRPRSMNVASALAATNAVPAPAAPTPQAAAAPGAAMAAAPAWLIDALSARHPGAATQQRHAEANAEPVQGADSGADLGDAFAGQGGAATATPRLRATADVPASTSTSAPAPAALSAGAAPARANPVGAGERGTAEPVTAAAAPLAAAPLAAAPLAAAPAAPSDSVRLAGSPQQWQQPLREALGERLQTQLDRNSEQATIRLDPPNMGRIDISIRHTAGALQVNLSASNHEVLRELRTIGDTVRHDLSQRQFGEVAVVVSPARAGLAQQFADGDGRQRQSGRDQREHEPGRALAEADQPGATFAMSSKG